MTTYMHKVPKTSWFIFHMGEVVAQDNCKHYSSLHKEFMYFECTNKFAIQDKRIFKDAEMGIGIFTW